METLCGMVDFINFYNVVIAILFVAILIAIFFFWGHLSSKGDQIDHADLRPKSHSEILRAIEKIKKEQGHD